MRVSHEEISVCDGLCHVMLQNSSNEKFSYNQRELKCMSSECTGYIKSVVDDGEKDLLPIIHTSLSVLQQNSTLR